MPCSKCGTHGHNIRTCTWKKPKKIKREIKDCCVCYEQLETGNGAVTTPCGHNYCTTCFVSWMRKSGNCAYCRKEICEAPKQFQSISDEVQEQFIDHLLEDDSLVADVERDIREQIVRGIKERYGVNTDGVDSMIEVIDDIMENFEPYFIMSIVGHETIDVATEHYEN